MTVIRKVNQFNQTEIYPSLIGKLETVKARLQSDKYHELFIAEKDEKVIALGFSWLNSFHPAAKYIQFFSSGDEEKNACIDRLLASILQTTASQDRWIYSCHSDQKDTIAFIEKKRI